MSAGLNLSDGGGIVRLTRRVLFGTFIIEGTGAVLLSWPVRAALRFPEGNHNGRVSRGFGILQRRL